MGRSQPTGAAERDIPVLVNTLLRGFKPRLRLAERDIPVLVNTLPRQGGFSYTHVETGELSVCSLQSPEVLETAWFPNVRKTLLRTCQDCSLRSPDRKALPHTCQDWEGSPTQRKRKSRPGGLSYARVKSVVCDRLIAKLSGTHVETRRALLPNGNGRGPARRCEPHRRLC